MKSLIVMITIGFCLVYSQNSPHLFHNGTNHNYDHRNKKNGSSHVSLIDSVIAKKNNGYGMCLPQQALSFNKAPASQGQIYVPDTVKLYSTTDTSQYTISYNSKGLFTRGLCRKLVNGNWTNFEQDSLTYDAFGNRISELDERWSGGQWINYEQYTYTYDVNGNKLSELNEQWSDGQLWKYRYTYTYSAKGKIQSELEEQWLNGQVWTNNRKYSYTYDTDGNKLSELVEQWLHGQWINNEQYAYTYDANGNKLSELDVQWTNGQWTNSYRFTYTHDANGKVLSELEEGWLYGQWTNYLKYTYTYDAQGNMLSELIGYWSDEQWTNYLKYTYTYDAQGNMLSELVGYWSNGQWTNLLRVLRNYDSHWNLISESSAMWSGSSWDPTEANFTINAGNYQYSAQCCSMKISYTLIDTTDVLTPRYNIVSTYSLSQNYPNPFNPSTNITFTLLSKAFVSLKLFDILGREVAALINEELSAGIYTRKWNAANMPSGVYFYRLQAGSYTETKKLVLLR